MDESEKILSEIKSLKIQGAEAVAKKGVESVYLRAKKLEKLSPKEFVKKIKEFSQKTLETRITEPCLYNSLGFLLWGVEKTQNPQEFVEKLSERRKKLEQHFEDAQQKISKIGAQKIKNDSAILTHCHSSTVTRILREAKKQGKKFEVVSTETRPRYQGRITAKELADSGIPTTSIVDSAANHYLDKIDLVLVGADAITVEGYLVNKIGTSQVALCAYEKKKPFYACAESYKFDPRTAFGYEEQIEQRDPEEVWPQAPKNIRVKNPAFDITLPEHIRGIITELGIENPEMVSELVREKNQWMFKR